MFKTIKNSKKSKARIGTLSTEHGKIKTPIFMPPATRGYLKSLDSIDINNTNSQIVLVNTYHMLLKPGDKYIKKYGGIHSFMNYTKPILSDSGGFQIFSLQKMVKITEDGALFKSPIDGTEYFITPEKSIQIQHNLGVDIVMAFDECMSDNYTKEQAIISTQRTYRWLDRCIKEHKKLNKKNNTKKLFFGIVQGGLFKDLRIEGLKIVASLDVDGIAIGGETIGFNMKKTKEILDYLYPHFPKNKPIYTMGVGGCPQDMIDVSIRGVDMFDCVAPARIARHGSLFVGKLNTKTFEINSKYKDNKLRISNKEFINDKKPIEKNCTCFVCRNYSRAYLRHLFMSKDPLYSRLATFHNISYCQQTLNELKEKIKNE